MLEVKLLSPGVQVREQAFLEGHIGLQELALEILEFSVLCDVKSVLNYVLGEGGAGEELDKCLVKLPIGNIRQTLERHHKDCLDAEQVGCLLMLLNRLNQLYLL